MSTLLPLLRHKTWATLSLFEYRHTLDEHHLNLTIPGTYGTILETLRHVVASEEAYVAVLTGEWPVLPAMHTTSTRLFSSGQSYRDVGDQMHAFQRDLVAGRNGKRVRIVAHSATNWALDHLVKGISFGDLVDAPCAWPEGRLSRVSGIQ